MAAPINPKGAKSDKAWRRALMLALNEPAADGQKKLRKVAEAVVTAAMAGDIPAAKEIGDRLDGKATQGVELAGAGGGPLHQVIEMVVVDKAKG